MALLRISLLSIYCFFAGFILIKPASYALMPPVFVSDVTPASFTINSGALAISDISIYISSNGTYEITEQFQMNSYPLYAHSDSNQSSWEIRQENESLRQKMNALNFSQIDVSHCLPATTYYFSVSPDPKIYSVTTALQTQFINHAPQLIVHFPQSHESFNPNGFLMVAQSPLAMYPVSAIVGDGISEQAVVNLSNFFDADGFNLDTDQGIDIQILAQGAQLTPLERYVHLESTDTFDVARSYSILINTPPTFEPILSQQISEDQLHEFIIKANDLETISGQLDITAQSSNTELVPDENINITYTGTDYVVSIEPVPFQSGSTLITLTLSDSYDVTMTTFQVDVAPVANHPLISYISPIHGEEDRPNIFISLGIHLLDKDGSEVLENICLTGLPPGGALSAPAIFEDPCWTLETTDDLFLKYVPPPNDHTDFALKVSCQSRELENNDIEVASTTIQIIMEPVNDPPEISNFSDLILLENTPSQPIAFTISDIDHLPNELQVSVLSENQSLFPPSSFLLQGTESKRFLTIQPAPHQSGKGEIVVTVSDGALIDESRFMVNVSQYQPEQVADFNGDGVLSLNDLIIALQMIANMNPEICYPSASLDSEKILIEDALYIIFKLSGIIYHAGDYNPSDLKINISEMLRLIQLHNAGGYHCDNNSEDGYAPEKSDALNACPFHSSDFAHDDITPDWEIDEVELNRFIEFYNADGYLPDKKSFDGFRPR